MKKILTLLTMTFMALAAWSCSSDDDDKNYDVAIQFKDLPVMAQEFVNKYYPDVKILKIEREVNTSATAYDVKLTNGQEVDFDASGNWISVDAPDGQVIPSGIALPAIDEYVAGHYPGSGINEIDRLRPSGFEVELTNGIELRFAEDGTIMTARK